MEYRTYNHYIKAIGAVLHFFGPLLDHFGGNTSSDSEFNGGVESFYRIEIYYVLARLSAFPWRWIYGKCVITYIAPKNH